MSQGEQGEFNILETSGGLLVGEEWEKTCTHGDTNHAILLMQLSGLISHLKTSQWSSQWFFFPLCSLPPVHFPCLLFSTVTFTAVFFGSVFSSWCVLFAIIKDLLRHEVCTADSKHFRAAFYGAECLQMWFYSTWVQLTQPDRLSGRDIMISNYVRTKFSYYRSWTLKQHQQLD